MIPRGSGEVVQREVEVSIKKLSRAGSSPSEAFVLMMER